MRKPDPDGDPEMVKICDLALDGDETAIQECERVIANAQAMIDHKPSAQLCENAELVPDDGSTPAVCTEPATHTVGSIDLCAIHVQPFIDWNKTTREWERVGIDPGRTLYAIEELATT